MGGLNGQHRKLYLGAIGILWSGLVAASSFAIGSRSTGAELRAHETSGHPVVATQLESIQSQLRDIKADVREIRRAMIEGD